MHNVIAPKTIFKCRYCGASGNVTLEGRPAPVTLSWGEASCEHEAHVMEEESDGPHLAEEFAFGVHHYG